MEYEAEKDLQLFNIMKNFSGLKDEEINRQVFLFKLQDFKCKELEDDNLKIHDLDNSCLIKLLINNLQNKELIEPINLQVFLNILAYLNNSLMIFQHQKNIVEYFKQLDKEDLDHIY